MAIKVIKELEQVEKIREQLNEQQLPVDSEEWAYLNGWPHHTEEVKKLTKGQIDSYEDKELNESYSCAALLQFFSGQIAALNEYTYLEVLYSWYYWFTKFLARYESIYGVDTSMRQQQFKIIEAIDCDSSDPNSGVDSGLLERIAKELGFIL